MAFNTIYTGSFEENVLGDRIDIYIKQEDFAGEPSTLLMDANPLVITYPNKEFDNEIFGCGAEINVINDSGDFYKYDSLFSVPELSNYVEIIKTPKSGDPSIFLFQGYILPDMYTAKLGKNISLTIPATDRLTTLDRYVPTVLIDTSDYRADEYVNANELMFSCIIDADVTDKVMINNTLENKNYRKDGESTVFDNIFFQTDNFYDDFSVQDDKKCMEKILKSFYSRIFYHNGAFHIERISDMAAINKQYALYQSDTSVESVDVSNNRIEISCGNHEIISGSPTLSYYPGHNKLVVNLKYKQPESLVENYFYDIQPLDLSSRTNMGYPEPGFRRWMVSDFSLTNYRGSWNGFTTYPDTSLWAYPVTWLPDFERGCVRWYFSGYFDQAMYEWADDQVLSTMFQFSPPTGNDQLLVKVAYKVAVDRYLSGESISSFQTRFALRGTDSNGNSWWLAKSNPEDTSTYWRSYVYTFDTSISRADLLADNPGKSFMMWEIDKEINITQPIYTDVSLCYAKKRRYVYSPGGKRLWGTIFNRYYTDTYYVPTNPEYIGQIYLDVYMFERTYPSLGGWHANYNPYPAYFGDFDVDIETPVPEEYLEASMGYFYNTVNRDLEIFDTSTIMYTNGIYNADASLILRSIGAWRDYSDSNYMPLQYKYMQDLAQMVSKPKYKFSVDVRNNGSEVWGLHNIFTHNALRYPDSSLMEFMCNGLQYNVKNNTYRLDLMEYIGDDNWRVVPEDTSVCTFSYWPTYLEFNKYGVEKVSNIVNVVTNRPYSVSSTDNWISWTVNPSTRISLSIEVNPIESARDGSIYIESFDCDGSVHVVSIHQDPSEYIPDSIQLTPEELNVDAGPYATEALCVVDCAIDGDPTPTWTAAILTGGDFITLDTASGGDGDSIYFTIDQNTGTNPRQGTVDVSCGTAQATFSICQNGTMILCTDL